MCCCRYKTCGRVARLTHPQHDAECEDRSNERIVLQLFHVVRYAAVEVDPLKLPVKETKETDLRQDGLNGHHPHACMAQKGTHSGDNVQVPETRRAGSTIRPVAAQMHALQISHTTDGGRPTPLRPNQTTEARRTISTAAGTPQRLL